MRSIASIMIAAIFATALFLIFSCAPAPTNPSDISNTKISLYAQSSSGIINAISVEDTTGNIVKIGAQCNLWNYVDSMQFRQEVQTATILKDSIIGAKDNVSTLNFSDTVWQSIVFNEMGTKTIEAAAFLNNGRIIYDTVNIVIYSKPAINHPPVWQKDTIKEVGRPGDVISIYLSDKCADADGDTLYFFLLSGPPAGDAIANPTTNAAYIFTPRPNDTGIFYPRIVSKDPKGLADTLIIALSIPVQSIDTLPPMFFPKNGPANNAVVVDSSVTIIDSIYDAYGIDSVYWTQNGKNPKSLTLVAGSTYLYSLVDTLHRYHLDTIAIFAQDKSTNRNKSSQTIILNYNVPPVLNDTAVSTNRNVTKTWTLNALSVDGDPLTWSRLTSPSALSGTVTGTLPSVTFTPAANWSGTDSFNVRVTDGHWSDTAKIKITVVDVTVAPSIVTPPSSATKNVGQSVTFSVVINTDVNPAPSYVWKQSGNIITTATTSSYTIGSIALSDSGSYIVTVANSAGTITSQPVTLTVNFAPSITTQPLSQTLYLNQSVSFSVVALGNPLPSYVWKKNGVAISGQIGATFTIPLSGVNDSGKYTVTVTNSIDSKTSDTARFYARVKSMAAGNNHSLILKTDGTLFACGLNNSGQLGDGTGINRHSPVQIMTGVQSIAAGGTQSFILKTDGTLLGCGFNGDGELGLGAMPDQLSPVQIMTDVQSVSSGTTHSLILKTNGILFACGSNYYGQLGDGTKTNRTIPVQIMTGIQGIATGGSYSLILKIDGTLLACGDNSYGQFGNGTTKSDSIPVQVMTGVQSIAAGNDFSLILKSEGTLFACGYNLFGQLGDGTTADRHSPVQIVTGVQSIVAGSAHSFILRIDGTLLACGLNTYGQLGDGTVNNQNSPIQIMTGVQKVAAGENHSLILTTNGTLFAGGYNYFGQLGDSTTTDQNSLVKITF